MYLLFFTREVFSLLLRHRLIGIPLVEKILHWRHTGFNVHSKVRAREKREVEKIGKYMARPILSIKKLFFDSPSNPNALPLPKLRSRNF